MPQNCHNWQAERVIDDNELCRDLATHYFLTLKEAAHLCGVSPDLLRGQVHNGFLRAKRTSTLGGTSRFRNAGTGKYLFRRDDLEKWFEQLPEA